MTDMNVYNPNVARDAPAAVIRPALDPEVAR